jgi:hypothetical protein
MAAKTNSTDSERMFEAVATRFPRSERAIRRLLGQSESFRDMCEELSDAESALSNVFRLAPEVRKIRRAEWQELVDRLVDELGAALIESEMRKSTAPSPTRAAEE